MKHKILSNVAKLLARRKGQDLPVKTLPAMKRYTLLWLCLVVGVILVACDIGEDVTAKSTRIAAEIFATQTAAALMSTPTSTTTSTATTVPTPTPTDTATPTPTPTATPVVGIGVPVSGGRWQVTVEGARQETELTTGPILDKTTHTPTQTGDTFLVVDFRFSSLDPVPPAGVPAQAITVIGADGQIVTPIGIGGFHKDDYVCVEDCVYFLYPSDHHLAFLVKEELLDQPWQLQFPNIAPIPFSVAEKVAYPFVTKIGDEPGVLPPSCQLEDSTALAQLGPLSYTYWGEAGLTLAGMAADGSQATPICQGVAYTDFKHAADGAAILRVDPLQGWPSLYAIEPDGQVFVLAQNSPATWAEFDPSGRYIFFTATQLGEAGQDALYVFDRETASTEVVKTGKWVNFRFLDNGRLLLTVTPTDSDEEQVYWGQAPGLTLEPLDLPEEAYPSDIADDGRHLVYSEYDDNGFEHLFVAELDGSNAQQIVSTQEWVWGELSPNGQFILTSIAQGTDTEQVDAIRYQAELRHVTTLNSWTIVPAGESLDFDFSSDSRYALVYNSVEAEEVEAPDEITLYVINTAEGRIIHEIESIIEAVFSPDNTQLVYSVRQADGAPAMYLLSLENGTTQFLGEGVIDDWWAGETATEPAKPAPTAAKTGEAGTESQTGDTITLAPTPTRPAAPMPTAASAPVARVVADTANLRAGPGATYPVVGESRQGDTFPITGRDASTGWWQVITANGQEAWVSAELVEVADTGGVPVVAAPPPSASTSAPGGGSSPDGRQWVLVADSATDYPGPIQDRKWYYHWSKGRNNFIWQDMSETPDCYRSPNEMTLAICRDKMTVDVRSRGDAALLWKAPQGGTYRFEWSSNEVNGDTVLWFYKHLDFVGSQGPGDELPYSAIIEDVIDWELFFWVPQYDTPYRIKIYRLQE
ncbi:MAG: SH3 domain-containing protein [Chloroflexota bacterium]